MAQMADLDFITFFFQTMLDEEFKTKVKMAKSLDVTYRTLQINFQKLGNQKGGCLACQNLFLYCCRNNISVDRLYHRYLEEQHDKKKNDMSSVSWQHDIDISYNYPVPTSIEEVAQMKKTGLLQWIYQYVLRNHLNSDTRSMAVELRLPESVLENALQNEDSMAYTLLFEQLLAYCARKGISIDSILREYVDS